MCKWWLLMLIVLACLQQDFAIRPDDETRSLSAKNLIGYHKGSQDSDKVILITAHYDHMGKDGAKVYHGADDNASGVGALIALATHFAAIRPQHTLIFAALDAEEWGETTILERVQSVHVSHCARFKQASVEPRSL